MGSMIKRTVYVICTKEFNWFGAELTSIISQSMFLDMPPLYEYKVDLKLDTINHAVKSINVMFGGFVKRAYIEKKGKNVKYHNIFCENGYAQVVL